VPKITLKISLPIREKTPYVSTFWSTFMSSSDRSSCSRMLLACLHKRAKTLRIDRLRNLIWIKKPSVFLRRLDLWEFVFEAEKQRREEVSKKENPLLSSNYVPEETSTFTLKRSWLDDTPFRNQSMQEPQRKKRFINDTIRNDFHRKFMTKYVH